MTGYNWENNASNAGIDWNQQSDDYMCSSLGLSAAQCGTAGGVITHWHDQSVAIGAASELHFGDGRLRRGGHERAGGAGRDRAVGALEGGAVRRRAAPFTTTPSLTDGTVYIDEQVNFMVSRYGSAAGTMA